MDDSELGTENLTGELESRQPTVEDLVELCRQLNNLQAKYLIVGGFAMRGAVTSEKHMM